MPPGEGHIYDPDPCMSDVDEGQEDEGAGFQMDTMPLLELLSSSVRSLSSSSGCSECSEPSGAAQASEAAEGAPGQGHNHSHRQEGSPSGSSGGGGGAAAGALLWHADAAPRHHGGLHLQLGEEQADGEEAQVQAQAQSQQHGEEEAMQAAAAALVQGLSRLRPIRTTPPSPDGAQAGAAAGGVGAAPTVAPWRLSRAASTAAEAAAGYEAGQGMPAQPWASTEGAPPTPPGARTLFGALGDANGSTTSAVSSDARPCQDLGAEAAASAAAVELHCGLPDFVAANPVDARAVSGGGAPRVGSSRRLHGLQEEEEEDENQMDAWPWEFHNTLPRTAQYLGALAAPDAFFAQRANRWSSWGSGVARSTSAGAGSTGGTMAGAGSVSAGGGLRSNSGSSSMAGLGCDVTVAAEAAVTFSRSLSRALENSEPNTGLRGSPFAAGDSSQDGMGLYTGGAAEALRGASERAAVAARAALWERAGTPEHERSSMCSSIPLSPISKVLEAAAAQGQVGAMGSLSQAAEAGEAACARCETPVRQPTPSGASAKKWKATVFVNVEATEAQQEGEGAVQLMAL